MNCTTCDDKVCRKQQNSCHRENFDKSEVIHEYQDVSTREIVQAAVELVDLTLIAGICMGHDILLNRNLKMDFTTFVVKDRLHHHSPLKGLLKDDI